MLDHFLRPGPSISPRHWVFYHMLKDGHSKGGCISVITCRYWLIDLLVTWCVGCQRLTNKLKKNSGILPGTLRAVYLTTSSSTNYLSSLYGLRSAVREKYDEEDKGVQDKWCNTSIFNIDTPMLVPGTHGAESLSNWPFHKGSWQKSSFSLRPFYACHQMTKGRLSKDRPGVNPKVMGCSTGEQAVQFSTWA